jgi:hypothetical protein
MEETWTQGKFVHVNPKKHKPEQAQRLDQPNYLLTQVCPFLALTRPCFFLSTLLGSRVTVPAENNMLAEFSNLR